MKLALKVSSILAVFASFSLVTSCSSGSVAASGGDLTQIYEKGSIVIGTNAEYPPFEFVGCKTKFLGMCFQEELQGLDIEIAKLIGEELSTQAGKTVDVHFKNMDFDGLIGSLQAEEIDLIAAAFSATEERDLVVDFSDTYYVAQTVLVVSDDSTIDDLTDLEGLTIGAQLGTVQEWMAEDVVGENGTVKALADLSTLVLDILAGNNDGLLVELPVANTIIGANPSLKIVDGLVFPDDDGYAFATLNGQQGLLDVVNSVIAEITTDGTLYELYIQAVEDAAAAS